MIKKTLIIFVFTSTVLYGQSAVKWYYEATIMKCEDYYLSYDSATLAWGESYYQNAYLDLWETSKNTIWLDTIVIRIDGLMNTMKDVPSENVLYNRQVYKDGFFGWGSTRYDVRKYYQEYIVHDGMITVPIARFIRYIYSDSSLYIKYGRKADHYLNLVENNIIAKWYTNWKGNSLKSGNHLEGWGGWNPVKPIPNNQFLIFGAAMLILYDISASKYYSPADNAFPAFYLKESTKMAHHFKGLMVHKQPEDAYVWGYRNLYPPAERISYSNMELLFVLEAFRKDIVFNRTDIDRYVNTFIKLMWNGSFDDPKISEYVDGKGSNKGYLAWAWTSLSEFDFKVWDIINAYHKNKKAKRKEGIARIALNAHWWK